MYVCEHMKGSVLSEIRLIFPYVRNQTLECTKLVIYPRGAQCMLIVLLYVRVNGFGVKKTLMSSINK